MGLEGHTTSLPNGGSGVPWRTKLGARVIDFDYSHCIGLPCILDFNVSDYLATSGSNVNSTQYGSNFDYSYVPLPAGSSSWYLDSGATHHVCQNTSGLNQSTSYSGNSSVLMGNGTPTTISYIGNSVLPTKKKLLHLFNVLCVPSI